MTRSQSPLLGGLAAIAALLVAVGAPSCEQQASVPDPPDILSLSIESTNVTPGLTITVSVEAAGAGTLSYLWEAAGVDGAAGGEFAEPDATDTLWTAPFEEGVVMITMTVNDTGGGITTRSVPVVVGPLVDNDGDTFAVTDGDCDDDDASIYPGAPELQDSIDNDCDGQIDEGSEDVDDDADGFSDLQGDCNDADPDVYPGAPETVDGVDQNCNGIIDDGTDAFDDDGDGFSEDDGDCDDSNDAISPSNPELLDGVDNDCDGVTDENTVGYDDDSDGFTELQGDCDDGDSDTWPGAPELPDNEDNDCNGLIDDGSFITDDDGDGFTDLAGDCDDTNPYTFPGAPEYLDGLDNDCDGSIDENLDDSDNDGDGYSEADGDCNDDNVTVYPGALELDDGIDNDCDGLGYTNPPTAIGAVVTGNPESCSAVEVTAASSYDPDGDTLDFTWFFNTTPPDSDLDDDDINNRFDMTASFVPDAAGYWAIAVQVSDGTFTSAPSTVGFTVQSRNGNTSPVPVFGAGNQVVAEEAFCNPGPYGMGCSSCEPCAASVLVDATASFDIDNDPLFFEFEATDLGPDGSPATVVNNGDGTALVEFNMPVSCAPDSATGTYNVTANVRDCNGDSSDTTMQIQYTCTPSL